LAAAVAMPTVSGTPGLDSQLCSPLFWGACLPDLDDQVPLRGLHGRSYPEAGFLLAAIPLLRSDHSPGAAA